MQLEIVRPTQEEGDICIVDFFFDEPDGGVKQTAQVGCADDRLVEARCKTDGVELFDEVPLCGNKVIAEYVYLFRLLSAISIQSLGKQAQSSMSLLVVGHRLHFLREGALNFAALP